ncbi:AAA family ATPase [Hyphomonas pacifica]|uniref:AAA family ATPase n=1 Tax=Hyphomonas pacifica TaxID=1280941 RepID=UPI000DBFBCBA|nr:AAA family ATPase [Hyphomonas pacifica]RAN37441.1 hypothetical protein HY11_09185 [Hyphomonas pacifica]
MARLIMLSGLPGSGKSTLGRILSERIGACLVRVDVLEQDMRNMCGPDHDVGTKGYAAGYKLASEHLISGHDVIADAVNAVEAARDGWRTIATQARAPIIEIEILCSSLDEVKPRLKTRDTGIKGLRQVSLKDRQQRRWDDNPHANFRVDTAGRSINACADEIEHFLNPVD